ncbi:MAG: nucleoside hydrolase [Verrucomicrobia bacterium]|nr:nucleoside hydrolase [Verrucomicrobiota bacterium]
MRRIPLGLALLLLIALPGQLKAASSSARVPVRIVFDTDMHTDCDDAGALAVLHALADNGECKILATVVSVKDYLSAATVDAINTYYGRPGLPLGMVKGPGVRRQSSFTARLAADFPHRVKAAEQVPDATEVYREVLEQQPDRSVVIVTVGYLTNLRNLLQLPAANGRPSGRELVERKVAKWVCMGGNFVGHPPRDDLRLGNVNFQFDVAATLEAIRQWPRPLVFVGREIGSVPSGLQVGANLAKTPPENPVRRAYFHYFSGQQKSRHVADLTTVLYAVRGRRDYWDLSAPGRMKLQPDVTFDWQSAAEGNQSFLIKKQRDGKPNDRYLEAVLEELLLQPPRRRTSGGTSKASSAGPPPVAEAFSAAPSSSGASTPATEAARSTGSTATPPYPPSPVIAALEWAPTNRIARAAYDGDNWPVTWADDDAIYTTWGDGTGFVPKVKQKLSLGFARVTGAPDQFNGVNVRSPAEQLGQGRAGKKGWGILCVEGVLYLWLGHADNRGATAQLAWSRDHAATWTFADWKFAEFGLVGFVNFGRNYAGARDEFVYAYSHDDPRADTPADRFILMRAPKRRLTEHAAWEFFEKRGADGQPVWTRDVRARGAVFEHRGACLRSAMTYCAPLRRYLWWQQLPQPAGFTNDRGDTRFAGGFAIYDAPEPWGPWTTAFFTPRWDVGPGEHGDFPAKWMSVGGRTLHLVFSGDDCFAVREARIELR